MTARSCFVAVVFVLAAVPAFAQQPAGRIKIVAGSVFIVRTTGTIAAQAGRWC
jgi:hypothetical protein